MHLPILSGMLLILETENQINLFLKKKCCVAPCYTSPRSTGVYLAICCLYSTSESVRLESMSTSTYVHVRAEEEPRTKSSPGHPTSQLGKMQGNAKRKRPRIGGQVRCKAGKASEKAPRFGVWAAALPGHDQIRRIPTRHGPPPPSSASSKPNKK